MANDEEYGEGNFEYRVQHRVVVATGEPETEWSVVNTYRANGRPYFSIGAARGVMTREKKYRGRYFGNEEREFRIQRRPVESSWETVE